MLGDLFYQLGVTLGGIDAKIRGKGGAASDPESGPASVYDPETGEVHDLEAPDDGLAENALLTAVGGWVLARLMRPDDVSWPRVILAGIAGTALADLVGRGVAGGDGAGVEARAGAGAGGAELPYAEDPEELMARFGAGIAVAAGYAALLYPRLPGPPLFRGLVFGALEVAAAPRGGLAQLAAEAPGIKYPLQALARPVDEDAGPLSHLAFGLALGLLYRRAEADEPEDDDDSDDHGDHD